MTNDDGRKPEGAPERSPKAGAVIRSSRRNWTIVRPTVLTNGPRSGAYRRDETPNWPCPLQSRQRCGRQTAVARESHRFYADIDRAVRPAIRFTIKTSGLVAEKRALRPSTPSKLAEQN